MKPSAQKKAAAQAASKKQAPQQQARAPSVSLWRGRAVVAACALAGLALVGRAVQLQVVSREFLSGQGEVRHVRTLPVSAHRGMLVDRTGEPLAISTPVWSIWADPGSLRKARGRWPELAQALNMAPRTLAARITDATGREFVWLKRQLRPDQAEAVMALDIAGVGRRREYRRYYPAGEVTSQVLGFTGIDDTGQEGLELAYDDWLSGQPGRKRVVQDRRGRVVGELELVEPAEPGRDLRVSLHRRLQYLAYRELKGAVKRADARGGSLVILDVDTGEVLAMANQPAFNPNDRSARAGAIVRNRAVTDVFEPGSTMKTLTVAAALETGRIEPGTTISTGPGRMRVAGHQIADHSDLGTLDVSGVIRRSSNVGASRIALSLEPRTLWRVYARLGLGRTTGSGFPGEASGRLTPARQWGRLDQATIAFGYGASVTALQLARAYATIAAGGILAPVHFRAVPGVEAVADERRRVLSQQSAREMQAMLETVVSENGTGTRADVAGYRVAGKTGTAHKIGADGYASDRYRALFAGFAPASEPRLAAVVVIDEPAGERYYGGQIAAPVFGRVMAGALRLLDIRPDGREDRLVARQGGGT
jgi:cell division protein FtsI (penicillin-binding protein 3)